MHDTATGRANIDRVSVPKPAPDWSGLWKTVFGTARRGSRSSTAARRKHSRAGAEKPVALAQTPQLPAYLEDHYRWAYLRPASLKVFDHTLVVSAILWGCYGRLKQAAFVELEPGQKVLQAACVYGDFSSQLAGLLGAEGRLDIVDVAAIQVENSRRKLREFQHTQVRIADAAAPGGGPYDVIYCFFLLHELPDDHKHAVVDALLRQVTPQGKVVFIDYHRPARLHPLKTLMGLVFDRLEPFARTLWQHEISSFATSTEKFAWRKRTYFGGLYQKVVAERRSARRNTRSRPQPASTEN